MFDIDLIKNKALRIDRFTHDCGIGDFISVFQGIEFLLDNGCSVHFDIDEKYRNLLPAHPNLNNISKSSESTLLVSPGWGAKGNFPCPDANSIHTSATWLPYIDKYLRHFHPKQYPHYPFYYPKMDFQPEVLEQLKKEMGLENRKYITFIKTTHVKERNWGEGPWSRLINILKDEFVCIHIGKLNSPKNSEKVERTPHSIQIDDDMPLNKIAHLIRGSDALISADTGMYHLGTAINTNKVIILFHPIGGVLWTYPSNYVIDKNLPERQVIAKILEILYDRKNM